jgi:hypothetical protein
VVLEVLLPLALLVLVLLLLLLASTLELRERLDWVDEGAA